MAGYIGNRAVALSTTAANVTGTITAGALDISGDTDVDGTTNLDVVDIDGAVDMASTLAVGGAATFNSTITASGGSTNNNDDANILTLNASEHARLLVDTSSTGGHRATLALESNGNETTLATTGSASFLDVSTGDFTIDVAGDISLQAGSGGERLLISNSTGDVILRTADRYVYSNASSGGTTIDVGLRFESATPKLEFWVNDGERASISSDGSLTVTHDVKLPDSGELTLGTDGDFKLYHNNAHAFVKNTTGDLNIENNSNIFIDSTHNITLDADGGIVFLKDGGSSYAELENVSSDFVIRVPTQDKDLILRGNDGGSNIDALTFDMSEAGAASFNGNVGIGASPNTTLTLSDGTDEFDFGVTTNVLTIKTVTSDGSDDQRIIIDAGSGGLSSTRGAYLALSGNEASSEAGKAIYQMGNVSGASHVFRKAGGNDAVTIDSSGRVGIGIAPASVDSDTAVLQAGGTFLIHFDVDDGGTTALGNNIYWDGSNNRALFADPTSQYSQTSGQHIFYTGPSVSAGAVATNNERMRIDNSGRVGIGLNNPDDYYATELVVNTPAEGGITMVGPTSGTNYLMFADGTSGNTRYRGYIQYNHTDDYMALASGGSERLRIDANGYINVGPSGGNSIGVVQGASGAGYTNQPGNDLQLKGGAGGGTGGSNIKFFTAPGGSSGTSESAAVEVVRINSDGDLLPFNNVAIGLTSGLPNDAQLTIGNDDPAIFFHDTTGGQNNAAIQVKNGLFRFLNGATGSNLSDQNLRMSLTSGGSFLVGVLNDTFGSDGISMAPRYSGSSTTSQIRWNRAASSQLGSALVFMDNGVVKGSIDYNNSSTTYNTSSDYRLKENVSYSWDATTRLKQLKPARFNFIVSPDKTVDGFLAHEVSSIVPEAITGEKDAVQVWENSEELPEDVSVGDNKLDADGNTIPALQSIDQSKLVPLLVKTIQELEARITALEAG